MMKNDLLADKLEKLKDVIQTSFKDASEQSRGFALRILNNETELFDKQLIHFDLATASSSSHYGGTPVAAYLGYALSSCKRANIVNSDLAKAENVFSKTIARLLTRENQGLLDFMYDDIAVLGVADGLAVLNDTELAFALSKSQLVKLIEKGRGVDAWANRLRALSAELIDEKGRLYTGLPDEEPFTIALDICLRNCWPQAYKASASINRSLQQELLKFLLTEKLPEIGDLERAVIWFRALNLLVQESVLSLVPPISQVVRILNNTQSSLKRWVWEEKSRRKNSAPARWLIDNEYHVQSFLWAMLYPIFGENLVDETTLPGYGLLQPRADFGITGLQLIIELKILREKRDFESVEEGIAGDLGVYFSDPYRFNRMIAYIYDDCDVHYPELYDSLRNALHKRDSRIEGVVIIRRPSMIPSRKSRIS
mgnify:CR=1 FL=1